MHRDVYTAQLLAGIERAVDVNAYRVGDTSLWGLFRTLMYFPLREALERDRVSPELAQRLQTAFPDAPRVGHVVPPSTATLARPAFAQGPVVILASGPSHTALTQGHYESAIADAWGGLVREIGASVMKVDVEPWWHTVNQPRRYPSTTVPGPTLDDERAAADEVALQWAPAIHKLFLAMESAVQPSLGISLAGVLEPFLNGVMTFIAQRRAADRWLRASTPSVVLLVCYYETCYLPVISAARALGIPTADLQHGMNGTMHAAYTHFTALPADGYDVLPDWFVTWGAHSSENITRWWTAPTRHKVIVGGRWDLAVVSSSRGPRLDTVTAMPSGTDGCRIVITMQDEPFDSGLLEAMRAAPTSWRWLVRPHPASARYPQATAAALTAQLQAAQVTTAEVIEDDSATLASLLRQADVHVTWASSSWLDAAVFGVPTVFVHPGATEQFSVELAQRVAFAAPRARGLQALIRGLMTQRPMASLADVVTTQPDTARAALRQLLGQDRGQGAASLDSMATASAAAS